MKDVINMFNKNQKEKIGFVRYGVKTKRDKIKNGLWENLHSVDVFTSRGLLIKTKHPFLNDEQLLEFIGDQNGREM